MRPHVNYFNQLYELSQVTLKKFPKNSTTGYIFRKTWQQKDSRQTSQQTRQIREHLAEVKFNLTET